METINRADYKQYDHHLFYTNNNTNTKPKVSICFVTYNQENYIRTALDSILEQKVDFDYEIVIGDDCSTDSNAAIIKEYANNYPDKIRAYLHTYNLGPKHIPSKNNYLHAFFNCNGEYIVHLEGDDYFCDQNKLQKQADFLDQNQTFVACFHNALIKYEDNSGRKDENINPPDQKNIIEIEDFLAEKETWFMATASVMMRRKYVDSLPSWFQETKSGDIPLYTILTKNGSIAYLPEVMSVYRKQLAGVSYTDIHHDATFIKNRIFMYSSINKHTNYKYSTYIDKIVSEYYLNLADSIQYGNNPILRLWYTLKSIFIFKPKNVFDVIKQFAISKSNYAKYLLLRKTINNFLGK
jgi:glycosyltransferase involved in cell wall biosynthesis